MTEQFQLRIVVNEAYLKRVNEARADGRVTDVSGLGKAALSHAMDHGQDTTTALLRNGHGPAQAHSPGREPAELAPIEQLVAAGVEDVKRHINQIAAVVIGVLMLLAVGVALYVRPVTSTA
jgi:hypothetical protein